LNKKLFGELIESMTQMGGIVRGERKPSREFHVDSEMVKKLRAASGLSQPKFAALLRVDVGTLRNWSEEYVRPAARQRRY
jgi:putative transcriptional regulator